VLRYVNELARGSHIVLFYDDLNEMHTILSEIVRDGLRKREAVGYLCRNVDKARDFLCRQSIDVGRYENEGLLDLDEVASQQPSRLGIEYTSSANDAFVNWLERYFQKKGRKLSRVIVDTPLDLANHTRLIDIEQTAENRFTNKRSRTLPVKLVCVYQSKDIVNIDEGRVFFELIKSHSHAIFPGIALRLKG